VFVRKNEEVFLLSRSNILLLTSLLAATLGALPAAAQKISVYRGNGQVICLGCPSGAPVAYQPLVVRVTDDADRPLAGVTVDWSSTGGVIRSQTTTGADGTSENFLIPQNVQNISTIQSYLQYTVTATTSTSAATFTETIGLQSAFSFSQPPVQVYNVSVPVGEFLTGQVGTTGTPIQVQVTDQYGNRLPNIALTLVNLQSASAGPVVTCKAQAGAGLDTVLTDSTGLATCTPVFGGTPGVSGQFYALVGGVNYGDPANLPVGYWQYQASRVTLTPGAAGSVVITAGANQIANPDRALATPLQVEIDSTSGTPLAGQQVTWRINPASAGTLGSATTTTDSNGRTSNTVAIAASAAPGTINVIATSVSDPSKSATFTFTVTPVVVITGFSVFSGSGQSASINTAFAQPLVVQVTASSGSAANVPVQFSATGPVSLSATSASTDANGRAQVTVNAGSITGAATVTATVATSTGTGTATFNLSVVPTAPNFTANNFVNGADNQTNSFSPCSITGLIMPQGTFAAQPGPTFPGYPLGNTNLRITVNNIGAPILSLANTADGRQEILFQIPCEVQPGSSVPVTVNGATTNVTLNIKDASPGVYQTVMSDNVLRTLLIRPDGSFVTLANPAKRGETVIALATGLGATSPSIGTGSVAAPGSTATPTGDVIVGMAGGGVPLVYAKRSEDLPGVFLVAFQIPQEINPGNDVTFSIGVTPAGSSTRVYSATTRIPVQ